MVDICLLGPSGMMPMPNRWLSVLVVRYSGKMVMIDCGEGTQIPLKQLGWGFGAIDTLLITHFHADHISGLPGLLLTLANYGKVTPLNIYGPPGLFAIVNSLMSIASGLPFDLVLHELPADKGGNFQASGFDISSLPVSHGSFCLAYRLYVPRRGKFDPDRARSLGIPVHQWNTLQQGASIVQGDKTIHPGDVIGEERHGLKIVYCTDSRPFDGLADFAAGADLFVCEGMYGDEAKQQKAASRGHMTMRDAALLAARAEARQLWLTHFSPSVTDPEQYLDGLQMVFHNIRIGHNLMTGHLQYPC